MKNIKMILLASILAMIALNANARDTHGMYAVAEALDTEGAKAKLDPAIRFYSGDQKHPKVIKNFGEFMSNKKTNAFNKSDKKACEWAFLSAMLSFQDRVRKEGGNAVVNIRSYYKRNEISSPTEYECGAGAVIAGVTFLGDVVEIAK